MEKRLCRLLEQKPEIYQQGRLIQHLANELSVDGDHQQVIIDALISMEEKGTVVLDRRGRVFNGVRLIETPPTHTRTPLGITVQEAPLTPAPVARNETSMENKDDIIDALTEKVEKLKGELAERAADADAEKRRHQATEAESLRRITAMEEEINQSRESMEKGARALQNVIDERDTARRELAEERNRTARAARIASALE